MTTRKLHAIAASLALLAFASVLFFPALFQGKILAPLDITTTLLAPWSDEANGAKPHNHNPTDAVTQYLPYRIFAEKSLREDGYIGWNPYEMGGYNLAANTMALPGTWTMQLHRLLSFKDAWNLGLLAEFLIAGTGMLVFLRSRNLPWLACLIGATAYMGNSQFIIWIYHRWALGSFCWMPWVLWSAADCIQWKSLTIRQLLLPGFLALALLGGSLQHMVFVCLASACLVVGAIHPFQSVRRRWPLVAAWSVAFLIALGIAAFSVIPQVQGYLTNISIGHSRGGIGYSEGTLQPAFNLLAIPAQIWPWLIGDPQSIDGWRLFKSNLMNLAYLGTIPMLLGFAGLFIKGMPRQAKWLIAVGLLIPLTPLVGPLYHRVQLLFLLGAAWMAAEMIARIPAYPPIRLIRWWKGAVIALGAALLIGSCLSTKIRSTIEDQVVAMSLQAKNDPQDADYSTWIEKRARLWTNRFSFNDPKTAWTYSLLLLGTAGLALAASRQERRSHIGNIAILGAVSLELLTFSQSWTTFSNPADVTPPHPAIDKARELAGRQRVSQSANSNSIHDIFAAPNLLAAYSIRSVNAYESIQYPSTSWILRDLDPAERLTLSGVAISVQPAGSPPDPGTSEWPVADDSSGVVFRHNPHALAPLLSGSGPLPRLIGDVLPILRSGSEVIPLQSSMNRWEFQWPDHASWIRISQNWHSGWKIRLDGGGWQPLLQGPDSACWMELPPGHKPAPVEVRFFPRPSWLAWLSYAAAASWLCLVVVLSRCLGRTQI